MEYNSAPPFNAGSPEPAGPDLAAALKKACEPLSAARRAATLRAKARLDSRSHV